ncbi:MAG: ImmA/IrrE family metallo-endopeptidase, partial [Actinomycetales bacterium]
GHVSFTDALKLAETQASHLLRHAHVRSGPTPTAISGAIHRLRIVYEHLPSSGMCFWDGRTWVICVAADEPRVRQRFTIMHELKHIIDYGHDARLYRGHGHLTSAQQAERAADYFAGCLLMPKRLLHRAWRAGHRQPAALARFFEVSTRAVEVRLAQIGLASVSGGTRPLSTTSPQQLSFCPAQDSSPEGERP